MQRKLAFLHKRRVGLRYLLVLRGRSWKNGEDSRQHSKIENRAETGKEFHFASQQEKVRISAHRPTLQTVRPAEAET
jgi:hypothetical protein